MLIGLGVRGSLFLDDWWYEHGATYIVGLLLCRLFGGTLKEELIFRGFLLNQLFLKLRSHFPVVEKAFLPRLANLTGLLRASPYPMPTTQVFTSA